ncbi:MAG: hypothetical protein RR614_15510 [Eubacterium sp.]
MVNKAHFVVIDTYVRNAQAGDQAAKAMLLVAFKPLILSSLEKMKIPPEDRDDAF